MDSIPKLEIDMNITVDKPTDYCPSREDGYIVGTLRKEKIVCFLHSCTMSIWGTEILDNMIKYIVESGLINVLDYVFINNVGIKIDINKYHTISPKFIITNHSSDTNIFENCTLRLMHFFCQYNPNYKILYMHTKGVSYDRTHIYIPGVTDWTNFMLFCLVSKYKECLEVLDHVDAVGCDYYHNYDDASGTKRFPSHFSGNFWWASSDYLKTLSVYELSNKHDAEFWLFTGDPIFVNVHSCQNKYWGHYANRYHLSEYENVVSVNFKHIISNLKSHVNILYGTDGYYLDITKVCHDKLRKGNIIRIPAGDIQRNIIFSDPIVGTTKHIRIGGMKYPHDENIIIKMPSMPINNIVVGPFVK